MVQPSALDGARIDEQCVFVDPVVDQVSHVLAIS
jgi:hypothetical protein